MFAQATKFSGGEEFHSPRMFSLPLDITKFSGLQFNGGGVPNTIHQVRSFPSQLVLWGVGGGGSVPVDFLASSVIWADLSSAYLIGCDLHEGARRTSFISAGA